MDEEKEEKQEVRLGTIHVEDFLIECPECKTKIKVGFDIDVDQIKGELLNALNKETKESGE